MPVPFDFEGQGPCEGLHPELRMTDNHVAQISNDCSTAARNLATEVQNTELSSLLEYESRLDKQFCTLARQIGEHAFPDPVRDDATPEADAVTSGIVIGRVFGRLLYSGRILAELQLCSVENLHSLFGPSTSRQDYEYWIRPQAGSLQADMASLMIKRGVLPSHYIGDPRQEALFYESAAYFAANGLIMHIASKTKLRTLSERSAMQLELKRWSRINKADES